MRQGTPTSSDLVCAKAVESWTTPTASLARSCISGTEAQNKQIQFV
jgi:hypothetical protein